MLHANCVALDGRGVLIIGRAGAGKSTLALQLMAYGAMLVADDRTIVRLREGDLWAESPPEIWGMIEARGLGVLRADAGQSVKLCYVVDLDQHETDRLPQPRDFTLCGVTLPLIFGQGHSHFSCLLMQLLRGGWADGGR